MPSKVINQLHNLSSELAFMEQNAKCRYECFSNNNDYALSRQIKRLREDVDSLLSQMEKIVEKNFDTVI